jgi:AraC family transcriptional regulator of adaptative response/methylated-DNA-[protein]-cysteine methyltransferase
MRNRDIPRKRGLLDREARFRERSGMMEITFTTAECPFGRLLVASSGKGLCMVSMGRSDSALELRLKRQFPTAMVKRDDRRMSALRRAVASRISGRKLDEKVPLDLHGTDFQKSVWKDMLSIPPGRTRSYAEVARRIGKPTAYRAVAQACGANPVPIVVPCHRVVASGGKLGGYTGGIDRKIALLAAEGVTAP